MHPRSVSTSPTPATSKILPLLAVVGANVALAFGPWFVRLADVGPVAAAFWRLALAAPVLFAAARLAGQRPAVQARGLWGVLALGGVAFAADLGSWHVGIHRTTLANATLFGNAATLIYPVYGFLVARAWPTRTQALALALATAGGGLLMARSAELSAQHLTGDLFSLAAGILYAVYFISMARARTRMAPLPSLAISSLLSTVPLLLAAVALGERVWPGDWGPLVALAIVSQLVGQGLMIYALGCLSPLVVGIALLIQPVVGSTIGWLVYDERLGAGDLAGIVLVAAALVLVRRGSGSPQQLEPAGADVHALEPTGGDAQRRA